MMFNDKHINAYQSIKAPDELQQKIASLKNSKKSHHKAIARISSIAACLILSICVISLYNVYSSTTNITVDGVSPYKEDVILQGSNSVSLANARDIEIITVPINIDTHKNAIISVSCGTIVVNDSSSDEMLMTDKEYSIRKDTSLLWQILETELGESNTMSVKTNKKTYVLSLVYDKATNTRTVSCFKK